MANNRVPLASTEQVAAYLGVPVGTLRQWRWRGIGPKGSRIGRHVRYRWADVEDWFDQQGKTA